MDGILPYFYNSINHMNYDNITFDSLLNKKVIQFLYVELDLPLIKLLKKLGNNLKNMML